MKTLIAHISYHGINPGRVDRAMVEAIDATLMKPGEVKEEGPASHDLVGFGSGVYGARHRRRDLLALVERMLATDSSSPGLWSRASSRRAGALIRELIREVKEGG